MSGRIQEYVQVPFVTAPDGRVCRVWCGCRKTKLTSFRTGGVTASGWIYRRYYVLGDVFGPRPGRIREPIPYPTICPIGMGSGNVSRKGMRNDLLSKLRDINEDKSHRKMCGAVVSPQKGQQLGCIYSQDNCYVISGLYQRRTFFEGAFISVIEWPRIPAWYLKVPPAITGGHVNI